MKKLLSLFFIVSVIVSLAFAQGGQENQSKDEIVTLRFWGGVPQESGPQAACDAFNEQFKDKGIQVEYVRFVNDTTGNMKLETNLLSGKEIDLFVTYTMDTLKKRVDGNMALDLTPYMEKENFDLASYIGDDAKYYTFDGKTYAFPTVSDKKGIVVNKDMFDAAGIEIPESWTFDEFREIAKKLTHGEGQDKVYGMFWNSQQDLSYNLSYLTVQTLGGDPMYLNEKETNFTAPDIVASVKLLDNMMNVDKSSPTHTDSVTQKLSQEGVFLSGKAAMTVGPWIIRSVKNTDSYPHDFITAFAPYPVYDESQVKYSQGGYGDLVSISSKSEHKEEAWTFLKWFASEGVLYLTPGGRLPAFNTYDNDVVTEAYLKGGENLIDADSTKKIIIEPRQNYALTSITNHIAEVKQVYIEEMESILLDEKTPEEGMQDAKIRADAILNK